MNDAVSWLRKEMQEMTHGRTPNSYDSFWVELGGNKVVFSILHSIDHAVLNSKVQVIPAGITRADIFDAIDTFNGIKDVTKPLEYKYTVWASYLK